MLAWAMSTCSHTIHSTVHAAPCPRMVAASRTAHHMDPPCPATPACRTRVQHVARVCKKSGMCRCTIVIAKSDLSCQGCCLMTRPVPRSRMYLIVSTQPLPHTCVRLPSSSKTCHARGVARPGTSANPPTSQPMRSSQALAHTASAYRGV